MVIPTANPPGISCRRLIPMSAGELACVPPPRSAVTGLTAPPGAFGFNLIGIDLLMPSKTQGCGHPGRRRNGCKARLLLFKLHRRAVAQRRMQPNLVVISLDE